MFLALLMFAMTYQFNLTTAITNTSCNLIPFFKSFCPAFLIGAPVYQIVMSTKAAGAPRWEGIKYLAKWNSGNKSL